MEAGKRTKETTSGQITETKKIGGAFTLSTSAPFIPHRIQIFERLYEQQNALLKSQPPTPIKVTLKDGKQIDGIAYQTTPYDIAKKISKKLAESFVVSSIHYLQKPIFTLEEGAVACEEEEEPEVHNNHSNEVKMEAWDMMRPLYADCKIQFHKFDEPEGKQAFWHSSAHMLGEAIENTYGAHLCIGPPLQNGFYYDAYVGEEKITPTDYDKINKEIINITKQNQPFQRVVLTKEEALEMFKQNPFKVQLISAKIANGGKTTAYRCGNLIDLCTGPHVQTTQKIKSMIVTKSSSAYWLGQKDNDALQRVYGVSFPSAKEMAEYVRIQEEIAKRDHRKIGMEQRLFEFNEVSAGSPFFHPHGTIIYNKLLSIMREEYRIRGYKEVITPNIYNSDLWKKSGHWDKYQSNMFIIKQEAGHEATFGVKPMNCPGHCTLFAQHLVSYRELPLRFADFGVLHRNELHGALSGLTRVRRFQQDDAHIFCTTDQIQKEIYDCLEFIGYIYSLFGFQWTIELSTRPEQYLGDIQVWDNAEKALAEALDSTGREWKLNPGDGAFYGPKIDIKLYDAMKRAHQCGTIQLDFQMPKRFELQYRERNEDLYDIEGKPGYARPVIVHRAILGSLERFIAILTEHTAGKYPFFISPKQVIVIPISEKNQDYAQKVHKRLLLEGFTSEVDLSEGTINKKVRNAQLGQYCYMAIVGKIEEQNGQVDLRDRDQKNPIGKFSVDELVSFFQEKEQPVSPVRQKLNEEAYASQGNLEALEVSLKKDMFLGGFEPSDKDLQQFKEIPTQIPENKFPNVARWARFMAHFNQKQ